MICPAHKAIFDIGFLGCLQNELQALGTERRPAMQFSFGYFSVRPLGTHTHTQASLFVSTAF